MRRLFVILLLVFAVVGTLRVLRQVCPEARRHLRSAPGTTAVWSDWRADDYHPRTRRVRKLRRVHAPRVISVGEDFPTPAPSKPTAAPEPDRGQTPQPAPTPSPAADPSDPELAPAWFAHDDAADGWDKLRGGLRTIKGGQMATQERSESSANLALQRALVDWLSPEVQQPWLPPRRAIEALIIDRHTQEVVHKDLVGTLLVTGYRTDFSQARRKDLVELYHRQQAWKRLTMLGGGLGFVLVCLATLSGYIRADEATRGYYTNRLRLLAAAAVGASGVLIYQVISHHV